MSIPTQKKVGRLQESGAKKKSKLALNVEKHRASKLQGSHWITCAPCLSAIPVPRGNEVAFWGRSNVGKSSLLNILMKKKKLARVSKTPGRTQALHFYHMSVGIVAVDLPGYGYAEVPNALRDQWKILVGKYLSHRTCLKKVYLLLDARHPPQPLDFQARDFLLSLGVSFACVLTKADALSSLQLEQRLCMMRHEFLHPALIGATEEMQVWPASAKTKKGTEALLEDILCQITPFSDLQE